MSKVEDTFTWRTRQTPSQNLQFFNFWNMFLWFMKTTDSVMVWSRVKTHQKKIGNSLHWAIENYVYLLIGIENQIIFVSFNSEFSQNRDRYRYRWVLDAVGDRSLNHPASPVILRGETKHWILLAESGVRSSAKPSIAQSNAH